MAHVGSPRLRLPRADNPELRRMQERLQTWADQLQRSIDETLNAVLSSRYAEWAEMYFDTAVATDLTVDVWTKANGVTVLETAGDFVMPAYNRLVHTAETSEKYLVMFHGTMTCSVSNHNVWVGLSKNGELPTASSAAYIKTLGGTAAQQNITWGVFDATNDDAFEVWIRDTTGNAGVAVRAGSAVTLVRVL